MMKIDSEKIKRPLRIAINAGCGFEGDAKDAEVILGLIEFLEAENAQLKAPLQWRLFREEAPKEGQEILLHYSWGPKETYHKVFEESLRDSYIRHNNCWIPYPERPEVTE